MVYKEAYSLAQFVGMSLIFHSKMKLCGLYNVVRLAKMPEIGEPPARTCPRWQIRQTNLRWARRPYSSPFAFGKGISWNVKAQVMMEVPGDEC